MVKQANAEPGQEDIDVVTEDILLHAKIAHTILETEEGRAMALRYMERAKDQEAANDIMKAAAFLEDQSLQLAQMEQEWALAAQQIYENASPEEKAIMDKMANVHMTAKAGLKTELEKQAYDAGAQTAAGMADAGTMNSMMGGAGGDASDADLSQVSDEDIVAVLDEMVQNGELPPLTARPISTPGVASIPTPARLPASRRRRYLQKCRGPVGFVSLQLAGRLCGRFPGF